MPASRDDFELFFVAPPGLEEILCAEAVERGFAGARAVAGGVKCRGQWADVWRANLELRGATRVLARIDSFEVETLGRLEQRARRVPWSKVLRSDVPVHVEAACSHSRLYHSGAVAERIADAIGAKTGTTIAKDAAVTIMARLDNNICTVSVDTSGELLHKRGHKQAVHRAPMRETLAALFLRQCGYAGREPVLDPMCGSGTFVIEAAEISMGLAAGRSRHFAFESLATFDAAAWQALLDAHVARPTPLHFFGSDRDEAAIATSRRNAASAGVADCTTFRVETVSELRTPDCGVGLVIVNPPYGERIGDGEALISLYRALGRTLAERFKGWRVGIITSQSRLAAATELPFEPPAAPVSHGGIRVRLYRTAPLA